MILYIHFGIYKAGSSYIQYICANQRENLKNNGIYFPESKEDSKMLQGLISKGNADGLEEAIKKVSTKKIKTILKVWYDKAADLKTNAVLISAEALVHQLAIQNRINLLIQIAKDIGYTDIKAMGFFRDLVDHALSTYKHRSKSGRYPDYKYWIENHYETPEMLRKLITSIKSTTSNVEWTLRKFQKDSEFIKEAFFKDWLKIPIPNFHARPNVNASVSLSEIKVLNHLKGVYPNVLDYFVNDFKTLPDSQKADDKALSNYINTIFAGKLIFAQEVLNNLNDYLAANEKLNLGKPDNAKYISTEPDIKLSDNQCFVLSQRLSFFNSPKGKLIIVRRKIRRFIKFVLS